MRVGRILAGVAGLGVGLYLLVPLVVVAWSALAPGHEERFVSVSVPGRELTGWQVWALVSLLALVGLGLGTAGVWALRSRKSAHRR